MPYDSYYAPAVDGFSLILSALGGLDPSVRRFLDGVGLHLSLFSYDLAFFGESICSHLQTLACVAAGRVCLIVELVGLVLKAVGLFLTVILNSSRSYRRCFRIVRRKDTLSRWGPAPNYATFRSGSQIKAVGGLAVVSSGTFYVRRAAEERLRAARALTEEARQWHQRLAADFSARAQEPERKASC
jgi:hypothetical protein